MKFGFEAAVYDQPSASVCFVAQLWMELATLRLQCRTSPQLQYASWHSCEWSLQLWGCSVRPTLRCSMLRGTAV